MTCSRHRELRREDVIKVRSCMRIKRKLSLFPNDDARRVEKQEGLGREKATIR